MAVATNFNSEGCHFQSQNSYCRLGALKWVFLVKGRIGIFLKIHPIWYHHPPQGPSYHTVKIFNIFWTFPLKAFVLKRIEYHRSNLEYLLTYFLLFIYLSSTFKIFFITFQTLPDLRYFFYTSQALHLSLWSLWNCELLYELNSSPDEPVKYEMQICNYNWACKMQMSLQSVYEPGKCKTANLNEPTQYKMQNALTQKCN